MIKTWNYRELSSELLLANSFVRGYRLQAVVHGTTINKNRVGILINKSLKYEVVDVKRQGDRIILVKLATGDLVLNVINTYAPQVGNKQST